MTQDEILSMAREAGITFRQMTVDGESYNYRYVDLDDDIGTDEAGCVMRFAALVAAKAVAEEREACAQACDECRDEFNGIAGGPFVTEQGKNVHHAMAVGAQNSASAIRARAPMPVDQTPTLPYDTARCQGGADKLCDTCLRWLAPGNPHRQVYMSPPASIKRGECAAYIEHKEKP